MDDVLGYSGRRCIVTGAGSELGDATTRILVDLGAEVHAIGDHKPEIQGLASFSATDLANVDAMAKTVDAIGAVVNHLFNCARGPGDAVRELTERVIPNMIDGAAITSVADDDLVARYTADRSVDLVELGIRINCIGSAHAWPLVLLGSPRSSPVTGSCL